MKALRDNMVILNEDMEILRKRTEKEKAEIKIYAI
jgi:molecular chaperone GrpE (heat shock protein)